MTLTRIRTILAAVADPSGSEQPAVQRAAQLARAFGARLILFHAAFDSALTGRPFFDSRRLAKSRGWLVADRMRLLETHANAPRRVGVRVDVSVVWEEPVHEAIVRGVLREQADLVVAGRHEDRANRPPQFRLTDWELMRLCPKPLLITHPRSHVRRSGAVLAALDPTHAHDKPASLDVSIIEHAAAIADALQVECHAVHCVLSSVYRGGAATAAQRERAGQRMQSRMRRLIKSVGTDVDAVHILQGSVPEKVPEFAQKLPAQMLAIGIISRRWIKRFMIGDTAEALIRGAPCDLLLLKPDTFRLRLGRSRKEAVVLVNEK